MYDINHLFNFLTVRKTPIVLYNIDIYDDKE